MEERERGERWWVREVDGRGERDERERCVLLFSMWGRGERAAVSRVLWEDAPRRGGVKRRAGREGERERATG
jgi:hypothetical protein